MTLQLYNEEWVLPRKAAIKCLDAAKRDCGVTYKATALKLKAAIMEHPQIYLFQDILKLGTWQPLLPTLMWMHQMTSLIHN